MIEKQYAFSKDAVTVTQVVANLGALAGGTTCGWASQIFGRRFTIIVVCVIGGAILYPYTFVSSKKIMAAAFFEQFCVQGAWGVVPVHLMELSPGSIRTFSVGLSYQLGNLASSASSTIQSTIGQRFPLESGKEEGSFDYGKVICIFMGCVYGYLILVTLVGPEKLGQEFDVDHDDDLAVVTVHRGVVDQGDAEKGMPRNSSNLD